MSSSSGRDYLKSFLVAAPWAFLLSVAVVSGLTGWDTWKLMVTTSGFKGISLALHQYHEEHGCFPPSVVRGEDGQALHSW